MAAGMNRRRTGREFTDYIVSEELLQRINADEALETVTAAVDGWRRGDLNLGELLDQVAWAGSKADQTVMHSWAWRAERAA